MKIIDTFYSVVAAVVAVILFTRSVAGDDSSKSKAAKGGPGEDDLAGGLCHAVLATVLVGQVYEMAGMPFDVTALGGEDRERGF